MPDEKCGNTRRLRKTLRMADEERIARALSDAPGGSLHAIPRGGRRVPEAPEMFQWCARVAQPCLLYDSEGMSGP